jgi:hypothetical protein
MRALVLLALTALLAGADATCASGTSAGRTELRVTYWEDGAGAPDDVWTLRCRPASGTVAKPVLACRKLAAGGAALFAATPAETVCTEIFGGPQRARVVGLLAGRRVWTTFTRRNGCEIARWNRLVPWLLPPGGVTR